ncbi:MAG TPA: sugar phosphate isomerase/epimerase family protein [Candidatus Methylomirabilis sp.]|nr:sugar phosphate isomerase/epimerase family protein [Candidatus Methylomirabilis sp.]
MRFGMCVPLGTFVPPTAGAAQIAGNDALDARMRQLHEAIRIVEDAGCDFLELGVSLVTPEQPESVFERLQVALEGTWLVPETFSSYVPSDISLVGGARDRKRIENYVAVSARRVAALGGKIIGFGSGRARSIPEGVSRETAEDHLVEFLLLAAEHARANGIRIAIEPLNRSESNILNSVAEAVVLAERVNRPEVGVLADFYHLEVEKEPFEHIARAGKHLVLVHVADTGRLYPGSGSYDFPGFWRAVAGAGYDDRVTIECNWRDFPTEAGPAMRFLRGSSIHSQQKGGSQ